jgi:hypothetical protein
VPNYTIVAEILQTRAYQVYAINQEQALEALRAEFGVMQYDVLEEDLETTEVEEID